jgi:hypothetical protein
MTKEREIDGRGKELEREASSDDQHRPTSYQASLQPSTQTNNNPNMFSLRTTLRSRPLTSSTSLLSSSSLPSLTLSSPSPSSHQTRGIKFEPKSHRTRKTQKGRVPIRTGGSTTGTVLTNGADYGVRVKQGLRITAKQLQACYAMLRLKMKPYKGTDIFMNVFPDRPICVKVCPLTPWLVSDCCEEDRRGERVG